MYNIMVLYILRHERREIDMCDFFGPLNDEGIYGAGTTQFAKFKDLDIDEIYSSPYKRALDTIQSVSLEKKIPIKR